MPNKRRRIVFTFDERSLETKEQLIARGAWDAERDLPVIQKIRYCASPRRAARIMDRIGYVDEHGTFHCPCGTHHGRGPVNGGDAYRCLSCGHTYTLLPPDPREEDGDVA